MNYKFYRIKYILFVLYGLVNPAQLLPLCTRIKYIEINNSKHLIKNKMQISINKT